MFASSSRRTFLAYLAVTPLLLACSPAPAPVSTSPRDPSNPNAAEGTSSSTTVTSTPASTGDTQHEHAAHAHGEASQTDAASDAGATIYVCPMHPEVTSNAPGVCPKCKMKLVPKK